MKVLRRLGERGTTMIEMASVMLILSLVMATIYQAIISVQRTAGEIDHRLENLSEARLAMATIGRDLRTGIRLESGTSPFVAADDFDVTWYANLDPVPGPKRVRLYINASDELLHVATPPDAGTGPDWTYTGSPVTRIMARWITNDVGQPMFIYYDEDNNEILTPVTNLQAIKGVGIEIAVRKPSNFSEAATTLTNRVRLPNTDYFPVPSPTP